MDLVLDASAAVRAVMEKEQTAPLLNTISSAAIVVAPGIFASEVANALWKYVRAGRIDLQTAIDRYDEAEALVGDSMPDRELATEALAEAVRLGHPLYDLLYAVAARRHGCGVLTLDKRLSELLLVMKITRIQPDA